jgi:raffinose/stachyose/melibiose transport system permease protein
LIGLNLALLSQRIGEIISTVSTKHRSKRPKFRPLLYLGLLPLFTLLIVFAYYPAINGLSKSFFEWKFIAESEFLGLENYRTMLADAAWWETFKHIGIVFLAGVTIMWALPLFAVELLISIRSKRTQYILRTALLFPLAFPIIVTIYMWGFIYNPNVGILNTFLSAIGLESWGQNWLGDPKTALGSLVFIGFPWIASLPFFVFLTGMQNIGTEIFEAAALDGASRIKRFFLIDLPLLVQQFRLLFILAVINILQFGVTAAALTEGGPDNATMFPILRILNVAFRGGDWGYAAALSSTLFVITFLVSAFIFVISKGERQNAKSL